MNAKAILSAGSPEECLVSGEYPLTRRDLSEIAALIHADAGIALNEGKASLVYSRLSKRLRRIGLTSFRDYCQFVGTNEGQAERREMLSSLTTNFTKFFRENHHFEYLERTVLPPLVARARAGGRVRIWSAGCSDGSEPYSIALTVLRAMPEAASADFKILATDIDPKILDKARAGVYETAALETVDPLTRKQLFRKVSDSAFGIDGKVKALITYRELNLMSQWPFRGPFDIIFCRNVVIYFDEPTQVRIWRRYADMLAPGGHLFIGHSERLWGEAKACFENVGITTYRRCQGENPK
ncbi:protein-glutamate O-methyltransferase [Pseudohoeflea coraliihabitans]|uniref:Chemotaxis protein methyltransferase n=1 Tax=Pseudohoeflea coraliihabitans TaxID=2860393 RepID=A0ABS6WN93_9HYPH|nr:protein-glutamate O-methyltransferase [Pseudohoeflea sp. DP4N28-3]MBW3097393.1 protein-glutamate O-methyltransferase [Pseudohoeflea sp. DP4N28-3]